MIEINRQEIDLIYEDELSNKENIWPEKRNFEKEQDPISKEI